MGGEIDFFLSPVLMKLKFRNYFFKSFFWGAVLFFSEGGAPYPIFVVITLLVMVNLGYPPNWDGGLGGWVGWVGWKWWIHQ